MLYDQLWPNQRPVADWVLNTQTAALFAKQGAGKTWITLAVLERSITPSFEALLVVPLANISTTWEDHLDKVDIKYYRSWEDYKKAQTPKVLLMHYEAVTPRRGDRVGKKRVKQIVTHPWSMVVYDESQRIKSRGSSQSRVAARFTTNGRRLILSGTPFDDLTEDPQEIWAQMRFLNPAVLGSVWGDYESRYLRPSGYLGYKRSFRPGMFAKVLEKVAPYCISIEATDVADLPPISYHYVPVLLHGKQKRMYQEMESGMVTSINGRDVTADLAITQLVRLQQICGGFVKDDQEEVHEVGRAKLRKLRRIVARLDLPIVIFTKYSFEVAQIVASMSGGNRRISTIEGKTRRTRTQTIRDFQAGKIDILVANVKAGGVGIDLFRSSVVIFYSCTHSYIDYEQALKRVHRPGQKKAVKIYFLYAKNTVDKQIYETILSKRDISEMVLRRFKSQPSRRPTMAKDKQKNKPDGNTKTDKTEKQEKPAKEKAPALKYGIAELSEALGIAPASVRVKLRQHKIEKVGGRYGWNTKAEMDEVIDEIRAKKGEEE